MDDMESHPSLGRVSVEVQACQIVCYVNMIENQSNMMDWFSFRDFQPFLLLAVNWTI
jgi:hypothetical protein